MYLLQRPLFSVFVVIPSLFLSELYIFPCPGFDFLLRGGLMYCQDLGVYATKRLLCDQDRLQRNDCYMNLKEASRKMSIILQKLGDWCLSTPSLWQIINHLSTARKMTIHEHCVHGCTVLGSIMRQGNTFVFPEPFRYQLYWVSSSRSDPSFRENVSNAFGRECFWNTFGPAEQIPEMHLWTNAGQRNRTTARHSTATIHVQAWRSLMQMSREMAACTDTASPVLVSRESSLTYLT